MSSASVVVDAVVGVGADFDAVTPKTGGLLRGDGDEDDSTIFVNDRQTSTTTNKKHLHCIVEP